MNADLILSLAVFGTFASLVLLAAALLGYRRRKIDDRLTGLSREEPRGASHGTVWSTLPAVGTLMMPADETRRKRLTESLMHAGMYQRHSAAAFLGLRLVLMTFPLTVGLALWAADFLSLAAAILVSLLVGLIGWAVPAVWIRALKTKRQRTIRRALPDVLDVIVICLEGGLSLPASFARVTEELSAAYPTLAAELMIVQKEIELGRAAGEAFQGLAERFDADELRSMAALIGQAERFGTSLVRTFRVQADSMRLKRHQYAEGQAQKAPVKLIFPTVLCIFPALYIVLMGPAGVQFLKVLDTLSR